MSSAWRTALWVYSLLFRFGGLLMAVLSVCVFAAIALGTNDTDLARSRHPVDDLLAQCFAPATGQAAQQHKA